MPDVFEDKLRGLGGNVHCVDASTVVCQHVPVNPSFFSRPEANVLIKLPRKGRNGPIQVFIDDDLKYTGSDAAVAGVFGNSAKQSGWRLILVRQGSEIAEPLVDDVLNALGARGHPAVPAQSPAQPRNPETQPAQGLLELVGTDLTIPAGSRPDTVIAREEEVIEVVSCLLRWRPARMPIVVGEPGVGKSHLVAAAARRLSELRPGWTVTSVDVGNLFGGQLFPADRENALASILEEAAHAGQRILALERIDLVSEETAYGVHMLKHALDSGLKLIGTCRISAGRRLLQLMDGRLETIELHELSEADTENVLGTVVADIEKHHGVEIDPGCVRTCVQLARHLPGCFPAKAIDLLDSTASRATVVGTSVVGPDDLYAAASRLEEKG